MDLRLYYAIRAIVRPLARLLYRVEIVGRVPPGPCIVAANHESFLDPPILGLAARQPLHYLAKVGLWRYRFSAWLMDSLGGIPIRRDRRDLIALAAAEERLRAGLTVAIFPQGGINGGEWTRGAARLALATGAPLVPSRFRCPRRNRPSRPPASSPASSRRASTRSAKQSVRLETCHAIADERSI